MGWLGSLAVPALAVFVGYRLGTQSNPSGGAGWGGVPRTLDEEQGWCPEFAQKALAGIVHGGRLNYAVVEHLVKGDQGEYVFDEHWAGDYVVGFYTSAVHMAMKMYAPRHADSVEMPTQTADVPTFRIGRVVAPDIDVDDPVYVVAENLIPRFLWHALFLPGFNCYMAALRASPFDDMISNNVDNMWPELLRKGNYTRKKDFVMTFYEKYSLWDGSPVYPKEDNNLGKMFWKPAPGGGDNWDDGLEKAIAFDLIGAHRLKVVEGKSVGGETLAFVIELNSLAALPVRPGFGKYGTDMYFSAEGLPLMLVTTDGRQVMRGDKDWQYWKFVWRSTLVSTITLEDHLHFAHFRASNILARASRSSLHQNHPLRRFLSIFTFGAIWVNNIAMHTLLGPNHVLHRSTPFVDFESLSEVVPPQFAPMTEYHKALTDDATYEALPAIIKETPYYADGRLLFLALRKMIRGFFDIVIVDECDRATNTIMDADHLHFHSVIVSDTLAAGYKLSNGTLSSRSSCDTFDLELVESFIWTVTGWHRHVGTVGDYFSDPDLAAFSWKEGESEPRPKQTMLMTVVAAFTGTPQPKLIEDYSHMFRGLKREKELVALWADFRTDLKQVQKEVRARNEKRKIKNLHMDPAIVECSIAV